MRRIKIQQTSSVSLYFPLKGTSTSVGYSNQADGTTPSAENVRSFEPITGRMRGGSRPGLVRYIDSKLSGEIQDLNLIILPSATALGISFLDNGILDASFQIEDPSGFVLADGTINWIYVGGSGFMTPASYSRLNQLKVPNIVWDDPDDVPAGYALRDRELNAVARDPDTDDPVSGTFTYTPPAGTQLSAGSSQVLSTRFTPDDLLTYSSVTDTALINANDYDGFDGTWGSGSWTGSGIVTDLDFGTGVISADITVTVANGLSMTIYNLGVYSGLAQLVDPPTGIGDTVNPDPTTTGGFDGYIYLGS